MGCCIFSVCAMWVSAVPRWGVVADLGCGSLHATVSARSACSGVARVCGVGSDGLASCWCAVMGEAPAEHVLSWFAVGCSVVSSGVEEPSSTRRMSDGRANLGPGKLRPSASLWLLSGLGGRRMLDSG